MSDQLPLEAYWMPYTGNRQFKRDPRIIVAAQDVWFTDDRGRRILDGHSGLWTSGLGHGHPEVSKAVAEQIDTLDFAPPFQFGHPAAFHLAEKLKQLMPGDLNYAFFTNSGSESADTSLKMARAYWRLKGQPAKTRFIGRQKGYHGVNYGGTAVGGIGANRNPSGSRSRWTICATACCRSTLSVGVCPRRAPTLRRSWLSSSHCTMPRLSQR